MKKYQIIETYQASGRPARWVGEVEAENPSDAIERFFGTDEVSDTYTSAEAEDVYDVTYVDEDGYWQWK